MSEILRAAVWAKAQDHPFIPGAKVDAFGHTLKEAHYGDASSPFGWEIDHYPVPKALGGSDDLSNLRALSCYRNRQHGAHLGNALRALDENPLGLLGEPVNIFAQPNALRPRGAGLFSSSRRSRD